MSVGRREKHIVHKHSRKVTITRLRGYGRLFRVGSRFVGVTYLVHLGIVVVGALTGIAVARALGPEGRGQTAAIYATTVGLTAYLGLSFDQSVVYHAARSGLGIVHTIPRLSMAISAGVASVALLLVWFARGLLPGAVSPYLVAVIGVPFGIAGLHQIAALQGAGLKGPWNYLRIVPSLLNASFLGLMWLISGHLNAFQVALSLAMSTAAFFVVTRLVVRLYSRLVPPVRSESRRLLSYAARTHIGAVQTAANQRLDVFAMAFFADGAVIGRYAVAVTLTAPLAVVGLAIRDYLVPKIAGAESADPWVLTFKIARPVAVVLTLVLVPWWFLADRLLVALLGKDFEAAALAVQLLGVAAALLTMNLILSSYFGGVGKPQLVALAQCMSLVVSMGLIYPAVNAFEEAGAAGTSVLAYLLTTVMLITLLVRERRLTSPLQ